MKTIELDEAERMAIDAFLAEQWSKFCRVADQFLTTDEIEALGEKLSGLMTTHNAELTGPQQREKDYDK